MLYVYALAGSDLVHSTRMIRTGLSRTGGLLLAAGWQSPEIFPATSGGRSASPFATRIPSRSSG
jgi:hypothetical protein